MSWLTLTIIAQLLNSIVALLDKYLVTSKRIPSPLLYVFYTGVLAFLGILIYIPSLFLPNLPLPSFANVSFLSVSSLTFILCAVIAQLVALWGLFSALKKNDASDVTPVVGSLSAIFALIISFIVFGTTLSTHFAIGFVLLVLGTMFISHLRFSKNAFKFTALSGLGFATHGILLKQGLLETGFDTGFFWFSILTSLCATLLLAFPRVKQSLRSQKGEKHIKATGVLLVSNKLVAGIAGVFLIKAIELGEVSLVQALGGLQFLFLFVLALLIGPYTSLDFGENYKRKDVYHKLIAISIIFIGFVLLFR